MHRRIFVTAGVALWAGSALALTDEEVYRDFRFNLINPGARSLALGGAFVALADDATAAQANPAGLGFLLRTEYFAELRAVDHGANATVVDESLPAGIDTSVATGTDNEDTVSPTFLSAVVRFSTPGRWSLGVSRQELLDISNRTVSSFQFTFPGSPGALLTVGHGAIDVDVVNFNLSAGFRVTDRFGLGATLTYSTLELRSEVVNTVVDTDANVASEPILEPTLDLRTSSNGEDHDVAFTLGAIYKREGTWHVGAVYRNAPRFTVSETVADEGLDLFAVRSAVGTALPNRLDLPDVIGAGGAWIPLESQRLTLALDVEWIRYSNLLNGYVSGVNALTSTDALFTIDDGFDYRLGAEHLFLDVGTTLMSLALRGGLISESGSTIRAVSTGSQSFSTPEAFGDTERQLRGAVGLGLNFDRFNLDFAADFAESDNEYLVSFIFRDK